MGKLKPLIVPQNTLELKDFSEFCKIHINYVDTAEYYKQQLKQRKKETEQYSLNIIYQHFLKTYDEWKTILNKKDSKIIDKLISNYSGSHKIFYIFRCLKTNKYFLIKPVIFIDVDGFNSFQLSKEEINKLISRSFEIKDNKIILTFYYDGFSMDATCYRQGKHVTHIEIYIIDLLDYSVSFEEKESISYSNWRPFNNY